MKIFTLFLLLLPSLAAHGAAMRLYSFQTDFVVVSNRVNALSNSFATVSNAFATFTNSALLGVDAGTNVTAQTNGQRVTINASAGATSPVFTNQLYVDKSGNDSTAVRGSILFKYLTIPAAMSNAISGDAVNVGAGPFTNNVIMSNGVTLRGIDWDRTIIYGTNSLVGITGGGCVVALASNCVVSDLAIVALHTNNTAAPIGVDASNLIQPAVGFTVRNVKTIADSDGVFVNDEVIGSRGRFVDCVFTSKWDCVAQTITSPSPSSPASFGDLEFDGCVMVSIGPPTLGGAFGESRIVNAFYGGLKFVNCLLIVTNGTTTTMGIQTRSTNATVDIINTTFITGSTSGAVYDIVATNGSAVRWYGPGNTNKSIGPITQIPQSFNGPTFSGTVSNNATFLGGVYSNAVISSSTNYNLLATNSTATSVAFQVNAATGTSTNIAEFQLGGTNDMVVDRLGRLRLLTNHNAGSVTPWITFGNVTNTGFGPNSDNTVLYTWVTGVKAMGIQNGTVFQFKQNDIMSWSTSTTEPNTTGDSRIQGVAGNRLVLNGVAGGVVQFRAFTNSVTISNQSPYSPTAYTARGTDTNSTSARIALIGEARLGLGAINDTASIVVTVTNGASVRQWIFGMGTAAGAATATNMIYVPIGPTNTFGIQTNVSSTGTATTANLTTEPAP
jgi:hypothetical protein